MTVKRVDTSEFTGSLVRGTFTDGKLHVFVTHNIYSAGSIEVLINELRDIRRAAFPTYVEGANSSMNVDLEKP